MNKENPKSFFLKIFVIFFLLYDLFPLFFPILELSSLGKSSWAKKLMYLERLTEVPSFPEIIR
ncbi:hypothetical protein ES703_114340 [subsurface metagenome]